MPVAPTTTLSAADIANYARQAGFPESEIATAVAVARAESGFNARAHNGNAGTGDNSYGLWQINMLGGMGPSRRRALNISANEALYDPATNARAAKMIWNSAGSSWRPWTTYTSGKYKAYLNEAPGTSGPGLDPAETKRKIEDAARNTYSQIDPTGIAQKVAEFAEAFRRQSWNWLIVLIAITLIILGVVILNRTRLKKAGKIALNIAGAVK